MRQVSAQGQEEVQRRLGLPRQRGWPLVAAPSTAFRGASLGRGSAVRHGSAAWRGKKIGSQRGAGVEGRKGHGRGTHPAKRGGAIGKGPGELAGAENAGAVEGKAAPRCHQGNRDVPKFPWGTLMGQSRRGDHLARLGSLRN